MLVTSGSEMVKVFTKGRNKLRYLSVRSNSCPWQHHLTLTVATICCRVLKYVLKCYDISRVVYNCRRLIRRQIHVVVVS